ncbi:MAG: alpha/beta hydrolase, partial [Acetobacteraceae bacterium]
DPEITANREAIAARPRPSEISEMRATTDARGLAIGLPSDVTVTPVSANGVKAEWTATPGAAQDAVILYVHGGGYVIGSLDSHRHMVAEIGRRSAVRMLALEYRLAPEHPFPAPVEDTVAAYRFLLESGFNPGRILIAGDSAGGGLVVGAMLAIKDAGLPTCAGGWCISPWVDMEALGASFTDRAATDPTVQKQTILFMAEKYLGGADPRSPYAAPIHGDLKGLPPLLIQVGACETLLDDSLQLARLAGMADIPVDLQVWPEMIHIWHIFHPVLGAGKRAIADGGAWVQKRLKGA